jgi:hypothetical protein
MKPEVNIHRMNEYTAPVTKHLPVKRMVQGRWQESQHKHDDAEHDKINYCDALPEPFK